MGIKIAEFIFSLISNPIQNLKKPIKVSGQKLEQAVRNIFFVDILI
jgi:hypothetical protein